MAIEQGVDQGLAVATGDVDSKARILGILSTLEEIPTYDSGGNNDYGLGQHSDLRGNKYERGEGIVLKIGSQEKPSEVGPVMIVLEEGGIYRIPYVGDLDTKEVALSMGDKAEIGKDEYATYEGTVNSLVNDWRLQLFNPNTSHPVGISNALMVKLFKAS